jgi:hypothetical protein
MNLVRSIGPLSAACPQQSVISPFVFQYQEGLRPAASGDLLTADTDEHGGSPSPLEAGAPMDISLAN